MRKLAFLPILLTFANASGLWAQGIDTTANKDEWEEINFEPGSCVLVDGFPSLVRAADQLTQHPEYRIQVVGHGDGTGSRAAAEKLGMCRANAIRDYLQKYGARPNQIQASSVGNTDPKTNGQTKEGRFMNRRATVRLNDGAGQAVSTCPCDGMKALQDQVNRLQQQLAAANTQNQQAQNQVRDLQNQLQQQRDAAQAAARATQQANDAAMQRLRDQIADLTRQVEAFKTQADAAAAKAAADADAAAKRAAEVAKNASKAAAASAAAQSAQAQQAAAALKGIQTDAEKLQTDARALQARAATAGPGDRAALEAQAADIQKRLDDLRGRLAAETGRLGSATSAGAAEDALRKDKMPMFSLLGLNVGVDSNHDATFTGSGRFFAPFVRAGSFSSAAQIQGEYMYFSDRREAQADIGLVNRWKSLQLGGFASFRNIWMKNMQSTGTLGQVSFLGDYIFGQGKVGVFGSKTFLNDAVINSTPYFTGGTAMTQTYLHAIDSLGVNGAVAIFKNKPKSPWIDGNIGWLKSDSGNKKAGGTIRFVYPVSRLLALTAEGGVNESLVGTSNNGRAVFGILFGQQTNPNALRAADHAVPMMVPRIRYEVLTRKVGDDAPVADAGPDQVGVAAGTITLDGSKSYSPDNAPLTYSWVQLAGPTVTINGANLAKASFTGASGQFYSFRLTVSDGTLSSTARTAVTVINATRPVIDRFTATPATITAGQISTLNWQVENADTVTISGVSQTLAKDSGTVNVTPSATTNYILTATNSAGQSTAVVAVTVNSAGGGQLPVISSFAASPSTISQGGSSTLSWNVSGADTVSIDNGVGTVPLSGSANVSPTATTTYTLTARNSAGQVTQTATVTVVGKVTITSFTVTPTSVIQGAGGYVTFNWTTQNAQTVTLSPGGGQRGVNGTVSLAAPAVTTVYTLTATDAAGNSVTANVTVTVFPASGGPQIIIPLSNFYTAFRNVQLDASGSFDPAGGTLTFMWISVDGKATVLSPNTAVTPVILASTYYGDFVFQVTVTNSAGQTASRRVTVTLPAGGCGQLNGCVGNAP